MSTTRSVLSKPGLDHSQALISLQREARANDEEIISFRRRGSRWAAELQKIGEFPPSDDEEKPEPDAPEPSESDEEPKGESESDDSSSDDSGESEEGGEKKPPVPGSKNQGPEGAKGEEKGELRELLSLVHQIADKLGISPGGPENSPLPGGPEPVGPPPPGPEAEGLGSAGKDGHLPTKMKPGEVLPHQTPIGSPAFASTKQANPIPTPGVPQQGAAPAAQIVSPPCSKCGGPTTAGVCANCTSAAGAVHAASVIDPDAVVGKKRTIQAKVDTPMTEVEAYKQATAAFEPRGYKVAQLVPQPDGTWVAVLTG